MFKRLFGHSKSVSDAHALYGAVVARARDGAFFEHFGVPDTFDGRFEMLVVHLFLLHNRLKDEPAPAREVSQLVFDAFIDDMDAALREAGVGDQTVPKRITKMTRVFYGRAGAFEDALACDDPVPELEAIFARNLYPDEPSADREKPLAGYMLSQWREISKMQVEEILNNHAVFKRDFTQILPSEAT